MKHRVTTDLRPVADQRSKLGQAGVHLPVSQARLADRKVDTGLAKLGALIGDRTEIGCNTVLHPGTILGRDCLVYPNVTLGGVLPAQCLVKNKTELTIVTRREGDDD